MKKLILTLTASLACMAAFAQGKISFANDSLHLVYYATANGTRPADAALAGQGVMSTSMPAGVTLVADLYGGTSSSSLALISSTTFGTTAGRFASVSANIATAGNFFQVQIRDSAFASADAAFAGQSYSGKSIVFNTTPGTSIAYNSIVNQGAPANSTWVNGAFDMSTQSGLAGARGAIIVAAPVPEPTSFALAGLGLAAVTIFRRRK